MNEKQTTILTVVFLVFILLAGGGAGYYFYFVVLAEMEQERDNIAAEVADARNKADQIPKLEEDIKLLQKKELQLIDKIPNLDRFEYDKLANLLDLLRRRSGVDVSTASYSVVRPQPVPGRPARQVPAQMHRVTYDLQVDGTFYQLLRFVNLLENEQRFINVESFQVTPGSQAGNQDDPSIGAPARGMALRLYSFTYKPLTPPKPVIEEGLRKLGVSTPPPE